MPLVEAPACVRYSAIGKATSVGNCGLSIGIGSPETTAATPGGVPVKTRSADEIVAKLTGWLNVTTMAPGACVSVAPLTAIDWPLTETVVEVTLRTFSAASAAGALIRPKPPFGSHAPAAEPLSGVDFAEVIRSCLISAGVAAGSLWSISATTAAALGAADEVPKKAGRVGCDRFVGVAGSPGIAGLVALPGKVGLGGFVVSSRFCAIGCGKNDVLPPSNAEMTGSWRTCGAIGVPVGLMSMNAGPSELNGSEKTGGGAGESVGMVAPERDRADADRVGRHRVAVASSGSSSPPRCRTAARPGRSSRRRSGRRTRCGWGRARRRP